MFAVQDQVNYGAVGVCTITDIRREKIGGKTAEYYVLEPVFQKMQRYMCRWAIPCCLCFCARCRKLTC